MMISVLIIGHASATDVSVSPTKGMVNEGQTFDISVMISPQDAPIAGAQMNLEYDQLLLRINSITEGNFFKQNGETFFKNLIIDNSSGQVRNIIGVILGKKNVTTTGTFIIINNTAISKSISEIKLSNVKLDDSNASYIDVNVINGSVFINTDSSSTIYPEPIISNATVYPSIIPVDTDNDPRWGELARINVNVTSNSTIASVTVDLSAIGGSQSQAMFHKGEDIWSIDTNASAGTPPGTYDLKINAEDIYGNQNESVNVPLEVMLNGDVNGDNKVNVIDAMLLYNYIYNKENYIISSETVADVSGDGVVDTIDAMVLLQGRDLK